MKITKEDIDIEKLKQLNQQANEITEEKRIYQKSCEERLEEYDKQRSQIEKQILALFPKGYWWSYDIDKNWPYPKKYSIKNATFFPYDERICITVKEVFKKKPWTGFTGEKYFFFEDFSQIDMYKTEEEAKKMYSQRICPKCGGLMGFSRMTWCHKCNSERLKRMKEFENAHKFYYPEDGGVYHVHYEDELTSKGSKGFYGKHFVLRRLDTSEIIHTNNLCSCGPFVKDKEKLPHIEFLEGDLS